MLRFRLGAITILLFVIAGGLYWQRGEADGTVSAFLRVGAVMAMLWVALPDIGMPRNPLWLLVGAGVAAAIVMQPKLIIPAAAALLAFAFLKPRLAHYFRAAAPPKRKPASTGSAAPPASPAARPAPAPQQPSPPRESPEPGAAPAQASPPLPPRRPAERGRSIRLQDAKFRKPNDGANSTDS